MTNRYRDAVSGQFVQIDPYGRIVRQRPLQYSCPHGNGIWFDPYPTYSRKDEPPHYRTKQSHPYSYDSFYIHGNPETTKHSSCDYSDRYHAWGKEKFEKACEAADAAGEPWQRRMDQWSMKQVDAFVKAYYGPKYFATGLIEWCNQASGYPGWCIFFENTGNKK